MSSSVCFPVDESRTPTCPGAACYRCSVAHATNKFIRATDRELVHVSIAKMLVPALRQLCCTFPGQYDETWIDNAPSDWDRTANIYFHRACLSLESPPDLNSARINTDWAIRSALPPDETFLLKPQRRLWAQAREVFEGCSEVKQIAMYPLARMLHRKTYSDTREMTRTFFAHGVWICGCPTQDVCCWTAQYLAQEIIDSGLARASLKAIERVKKDLELLAPQTIPDLDELKSAIVELVLKDPSVLAVIMALHPRLGERSILQTIDPGVVLLEIAPRVFEPNPLLLWSDLA
jgi:hypothetical protein